MSTLSDLLAEHTALSGAAVAHLQSLVSEWQLLADLSFSDLCLWVCDAPEQCGHADDAAHFVCVSQVRPTTGPTVHQDDLVGARAVGHDAALLGDACAADQIVSEFPDVHERAPGSTRTYRREVLPVRLSGETVAYLSRDAGSNVGREASLLETAYIDAAEDLFQMVYDGTFPPPLHPGEIHTGPRAGDGLLRVDADGRVVYVSPNALSAYHRMNHPGGVTGEDLASLTRKLIADPFDGAELAARISGAVQGRASLRMEVEVRAATVLFRALPLRPRGPAERGPGAGAGRHRGAASRPRPPQQGRDHPRDPSPGQEQPADRGRAAATAGAAVPGAGRAARPRRVGPAGLVHRFGARHAVDFAGRPGQSRSDRRPTGADGGRGGFDRDPGTCPPERQFRCPGRGPGHSAGHGAGGTGAKRPGTRISEPGPTGRRTVEPVTPTW